MLGKNALAGVCFSSNSLSCVYSRRIQIGFRTGFRICAFIVQIQNWILILILENPKIGGFFGFLLAFIVRIWILIYLRISDSESELDC